MLMPNGKKLKDCTGDECKVIGEAWNDVNQKLAEAAREKRIESFAQQSELTRPILKPAGEVILAGYLTSYPAHKTESTARAESRRAYQ
jgi:hypothetical protein